MQEQLITKRLRLFVIDAFELSERYGTPVLFRPTTRVCHGNAPVALRETVAAAPAAVRFHKDSRWVIFPRLSYQNHIRIEQQLPVIADELSSYRFNTLAGAGRLGIVTQGISSGYVGEALGILADLDQQGHPLPAHKLLRVATPHPFPKRLALDFLDGLDRVLVVEELDPFIERELQRLAGERQLQVTVLGKASGHIQVAGENTSSKPARIARLVCMEMTFQYNRRMRIYRWLSFVTLCSAALAQTAREAARQSQCKNNLKQLGLGLLSYHNEFKSFPLGNAEPLNMVDTCLCMGAGITMAQGLHVVQPDAIHFAFIGDSTFFHSGITGVINAVYNRTPIVIVVLDNATTAMTGLQPHPGTGATMMGSVSQKVDIATVLRGCGVGHVEKPHHLLDHRAFALAHAVRFDIDNRC